jgi:protein ImuA
MNNCPETAMTPQPDHSRPDHSQGQRTRQRLDALRARIARIETGRDDDDAVPARRVPLGLNDIDRHLPGGGLARGGVHEVIAGDRSAAALGFALWAISCFAPTRPWLWCSSSEAPTPYAPALDDFGLAPRRLLFAQAAFAREALWAAEEGLATPTLGAVLAEARTLTPVAARRLALAARDSGVPLLLVRPEGAEAAGPVATRWRVASAPGGVWEIALLRAGGSFPRRWRVIWRGPEGARPLPVDRPHDCPLEITDAEATGDRLMARGAA